MKSFYTVLLLMAGLLASSHSVAQGSLAALDAKNGFRDMKFGMPLKACGGMVLIPFDSDDPYQNYNRKSDRLRMGDIPLKEINYMFYKGSLIRVQVWVYGKENRERVLKALSYAYGQPSLKYKPKLDWFGKRVEMFYMNHTDYDENLCGYFEITSKIMREAIELQRKNYEKVDQMKATNAVRKAASDL